MSMELLSMLAGEGGCRGVLSLLVSEYRWHCESILTSENDMILTFTIGNKQSIEYIHNRML